MILLPNEEYEQLIADQKLLQALEANGVDNWIGYDDAVREATGEDFLAGFTCNTSEPEECESCQ